MTDPSVNLCARTTDSRHGTRPEAPSPGVTQARPSHWTVTRYGSISTRSAASLRGGYVAERGRASAAVSESILAELRKKTLQDQIDEMLDCPAAASEEVNCVVGPQKNLDPPRPQKEEINFKPEILSGRGTSLWISAQQSAGSAIYQPKHIRFTPVPSL